MKIESVYNSVQCVSVPFVTSGRRYKLTQTGNGSNRGPSRVLFLFKCRWLLVHFNVPVVETGPSQGPNFTQVADEAENNHEKNVFYL
jgi:hypothetical protein